MASRGRDSWNPTRFLSFTSKVGASPYEMTLDDLWAQVISLIFYLDRGEYLRDRAFLKIKDQRFDPESFPGIRSPRAGLE